MLYIFKLMLLELFKYSGEIELLLCENEPVETRQKEDMRAQSFSKEVSLPIQFN